MTACDVCGGPVDPDVTHVQHQSMDAWCQSFDCDCPEVCAGCCTDPDCPTRDNQETTVTDPAPLTDEQIHELLARAENETGVGIIDDLCDCLEILFALVEQTRKERDAAYACIRLLRDGYKPLGGWWDDGRPADPMSSAEIDAIRRARAGTEKTTDA